MEDYERNGPLGDKGVGEPAVLTGAASIDNDISAAVGHEFRERPSPERIVAALALTSPSRPQCAVSECVRTNALIGPSCPRSHRSILPTSLRGKGGGCPYPRHCEGTGGDERRWEGRRPTLLAAQTARSQITNRARKPRPYARLTSARALRPGNPLSDEVGEGARG